MGRTATKTQEPVTDVVLNPTSVATIEKAQDAVARLDQEADEILAAGIDIGRLEALDFVAVTANTAMLAIYENVKKSKAWRFIRNPQNGRNGQFESLEEFCEVKLGKSYKRLRTLAAQKNLLGQDAYEQAERLGLRDVDYNAIKALPAPDQELVRRAVEEAQSRDEVLDLLQELAARHAKEKKEAEDTRLQLEADNKFLADKRDKEAQRADKAEKALQSGPRTQPLSERLATFAADVDKASNAASEALIQLGQHIQALEQWWLEEAVQLPGYDPERVTPMPPEVLAVAQKLHDSTQSMALAVGHLQHDVRLVFGDEIDLSRTHLLQSDAAAQAE